MGKCSSQSTLFSLTNLAMSLTILLINFACPFPYGQLNLVKIYSYRNFVMIYCNVGFECLSLHPFSNIIYGYKNVFVTSKPSCRFDWSKNIWSPFHIWFL